MGWFSDLFTRGKRAAPAPSAALTEGVASAIMGSRGPPRRGTRELIASYKEAPWLRAVAGKIARGVANAQWSVYARAAEPMMTALPSRMAPAWRWGVDRSVRDHLLSSGDFYARARRRAQLRAAGLLREVPDHPLLAVLARPNAEMTGRSALQVSQVWLDIKGEAFWLLQSDAAGIVTGYLPVPPHWVSAVPTIQRPTFRLSAAAMQLEVKPEAVLWLRELDPENPYGRGTGVAESLGDELETDEYAAKFIKGWFYNSAKPDVIVSVDGMGAADAKRTKEQWEADYRGPGSNGRTHFTGGKMNVARLDSSFKDMQLAELRKLQRDTIVQVFGVPPETIGIIENSNRSTIDAARYIYALGVEFPRVEFLRSELQHQLVGRFNGDAVLEAEVSVPDDEAHRLAVMVAQAPAFALNEWRAEAGYDAEPLFKGVYPPLAQPGQQLASGATAKDAPETEDVEDADKTELEPEVPGDDDRARGDPPWARQLHG